MRGSRGHLSTIPAELATLSTAQQFATGVHQRAKVWRTTGNDGFINRHAVTVLASLMERRGGLVV